MKIGIALGSGSARGWSHLGVLQKLFELGIQPAIVTGASVGSLVGGAYASGSLSKLEQWACSLSRVDVWRLLDATLGTKGGIMKGDRLMRAIAEQVQDCNIEELPIPFATVAADLTRGTEVWIKSGSLHQAIRASSGFPGLFAPVQFNQRWVIDGGVVNPVPVSLCRALGADFVIAVNLNRSFNDWKNRDERVTPASKVDREEKQQEQSAMQKKWSHMLDNFIGSRREERKMEPRMIEVMSATINIMQERITRSRMVGDPPDATISPALADFQLMDFHRATEAIDAGQVAVARAMPELEVLLGQPTS